jgi:hypothetical protein
MLLFVTALPIPAQDGHQDELTLESLLKFMGGTTIGDSLSISDALMGFFRTPETINTLNKVWQDNVITESRLLKDLNIKFKTFKVNNADSSFGLGLSYSFSKDVTKKRLSPGSQAGISLSLQTEGNVAFEKNINPEDFLNSHISFHLFKSWGGTFSTTTSALRDSLNKWEIDLALIEEGETLLKSPVLEKFVSLSKSHLADQFYADFYFSGGLESNQDFTHKQYTYGANLGIDIKLWRNDFLNVFDWPFAAIRWLSGYDDELTPIGGSFPTFLFSLERVNPQNFEARILLGDTADYTRIHGEVVFKTPLSSSSYFEASFRFYKELNPSANIKNAELDENVYFTASLTSFGGMFISYSTGRLPFNVKDNETYKLGFAYNF